MKGLDRRAAQSAHLLLPQPTCAWPLTSPKRGTSEASDLGTTEVDHLPPSLCNNLARCCTLAHTNLGKEETILSPGLSTAAAWSTVPAPEEASVSN